MRAYAIELIAVFAYGASMLNGCVNRSVFVTVLIKHGEWLRAQHIIGRRTPIRYD